MRHPTLLDHRYRQSIGMGLRKYLTRLCINRGGRLHRNRQSQQKAEGDDRRGKWQHGVSMRGFGFDPRKFVQGCGARRPRAPSISVAPPPYSVTRLAGTRWSTRCCRPTGWCARNPRSTAPRRAELPLSLYQSRRDQQSSPARLRWRADHLPDAARLCRSPAASQTFSNRRGNAVRNASPRAPSHYGHRVQFATRLVPGCWNQQNRSGTCGRHIGSEASSRGTEAAVLIWRCRGVAQPANRFSEHRVHVAEPHEGRERRGPRPVPVAPGSLTARPAAAWSSAPHASSPARSREREQRSRQIAVALSFIDRIRSSRDSKLQLKSLL